MEKIKELVAACDNESYMLSGQMIELRAIQKGVRRLLEGIDDIVQKQTNISSTNQGHGLCYYFFIVEVKESRPASGTN